MKDEWFSGKFNGATIKYDLLLFQLWLKDLRVLNGHHVSLMGRRICFLQDLSANNPSALYYLYPFTASVQHFKKRSKLQISEDEHEF